MADFSTTDWLAIYGAVASSLGGIWSFYQWWRRGPKLVGYSTPNMIVIGGPVIDDHQKYIYLSLSNRGNAGTTISNVGLFGYDTVLKYIFGKPSFTAIVNHSDTAYILPGTIEAGKDWKSKCIQNAELEELTRSKIFCFAVFHSFADKPVRIKIHPIPRK